jgi:hypothetical protein
MTKQSAITATKQEFLPPAPPGVDFAVWSKIVERVRAERPQLASALEFAAPMALGPAGLVLGFPPGSFVTAQALEPRHVETLTRAVRDELGPEATLSIELTEASRTALTLAKIKAAKRASEPEEEDREIVVQRTVLNAFRRVRVKAVDSDTVTVLVSDRGGNDYEIELPHDRQAAELAKLISYSFGDRDVRVTVTIEEIGVARCRGESK